MNKKRGCIVGLIAVAVCACCIAALSRNNDSLDDGLPSASTYATATRVRATSAPTNKTPTSSPHPTDSPTSTPSPTPGTTCVDHVLAYSPGPGAKDAYSDPSAILGPPDIVESPCCQGMVQLGRGGVIVLAFVDNAVIDGPGPDLQIYGESARDDYIRVEVSQDLETWFAFPTVDESPGGLDLQDVGLERVLYVRITDVQPATATGAELDAVIALHNTVGVGSLPPDVISSDTRANIITLPTDTPKPTARPQPTATPRPKATAKPQPVCNCGGDIYNCSNFSSQASAQACYNYCRSQGRGDVHILDADNDGVACESLR